MESRMVRRLVMMAVAVVFAMGLVRSVDARAVPDKLTNFWTTALDGDTTDDSNSFNWVFCSQATRVVKPDGSAVESYQCELLGFVDGETPFPGDVFGAPVFPGRAMRFDDDTGAFYFSDFLFINNGGQVCFADLWFEQLTPSGKVHFRAVYDEVANCV